MEPVTLLGILVALWMGISLALVCILFVVTSRPKRSMAREDELAIIIQGLHKVIEANIPVTQDKNRKYASPS